MRFEIHGRTIDQHGTKLGLQGDNEVERVEFVMPNIYNNIDLSHEGTAYLLYKMPSGKDGFIILDKAADETNLVLSWLVGSEITEEIGFLQVQIKISGIEKSIWHSDITMFEVKRSLNVESPQPVVFSAGKRARIASPDSQAPSNEPPITVSERKITIPPILQNIAVQNDENSETVLFKLPRYFDGQDLSVMQIYLKTIMPQDGGRDDLLWSNMTVTTDEITWWWTLKPPQTLFNGNITLQLVVLGTRSDGLPFEWKTDGLTTVNIMRSPDAEPVIPSTPSIMDDFLKRISAIASQAKTSETNAKASEVKSATSAANAKVSETNAAGSAANAKVSETNAAGSASNAKISETNSKISETASADSLTEINTGLVSKLSITEANALIKNITLDSTTGIFTFTRYDGTAFSIDTGLEKIIFNFSYDAVRKELVLVLETGAEIRVPLADLIDDYEGLDTATISVEINGNNQISAYIKGNSISINLLTPSLQALINGKVNANENNNASQIKFADGDTMQQKLDKKELNGKDGVSVSVSGFYHMYVNAAGDLMLMVNDNTNPPPLSLDASGNLIYTIGGG